VRAASAIGVSTFYQGGIERAASGIINQDIQSDIAVIV
jgi:hypothetical protein